MIFWSQLFFILTHFDSVKQCTNKSLYNFTNTEMKKNSNKLKYSRSKSCNKIEYYFILFYVDVKKVSLHSYQFSQKQFYVSYNCNVCQTDDNNGLKNLIPRNIFNKHDFFEKKCNHFLCLIVFSLDYNCFTKINLLTKKYGMKISVGNNKQVSSTNEQC